MIRKLVFCLVMWVACTALPVRAQCDPMDPFCVDPDTKVPLDGGVCFLIAGGILYGIKKLRDKNTNRFN